MTTLPLLPQVAGTNIETTLRQTQATNQPPAIPPVRGFGPVTVVRYTPQFEDPQLATNEYLEVVVLLSETGYVLDSEIVLAGGTETVIASVEGGHPRRIKMVAESEGYRKSRHVGRRLRLFDLDRQFIRSGHVVELETKGDFTKATVSAAVLVLSKEKDRFVRFVTPASFRPGTATK